jgi:hypothetical protein
MVQREFERWLETTFGQAFISVPIFERGPGSKFAAEFEALKQEFEQDMARSYFLGLPMSLQGNDYYLETEELIKLDG